MDCFSSPTTKRVGAHGLVRALAREDLLGQLVQNGPLDVAGVLELIHEEMKDLPVEPVEDVGRFLPLEKAIGVDLEVVEVQKSFPQLRVLILFFGALEQPEQADRFVSCLARACSST